MSATALNAVPESAKMCCPPWFHKKGLEMRLFSRSKSQVVISGSEARTTITKADTLHERTVGWFIDWEMVQQYPYGIGVSGRRHFSDEELAAAFGLSDSEGKSGQSLRHKYLLQSVEEGKYGRTGNYLNIPSPGTGCNGDPNISVYITEEIRKAIAAILGFRE